MKKLLQLSIKRCSIKLYDHIIRTIDVSAYFHPNDCSESCENFIQIPFKRMYGNQFFPSTPTPLTPWVISIALHDYAYQYSCSYNVIVRVMVVLKITIKKLLLVTDVLQPERKSAVRCCLGLQEFPLISLVKCLCIINYIFFS